MSHPDRTSHLPPFSAAATQLAVEASKDCYPADYIISILLEISRYLVSLDEQATLFGRSDNDTYSPSLRNLYSRLHDGQLNPSPIQSHANESARINATLGRRTTKAAAYRPLEDFEDLYYAVLARMQDIHQILNARLGSGFSTFTDLVHQDGPSIADLYVSLAQYWDALNQNAFVKPIDCAVRRSRVKYLHEEILTQMHNDEITQTDAEELLSDLLDPKEYDGMQGLAWISGWAPSMVSAWLEEKYRMVLKAEKEEVKGKSRMERKRAKMGKKMQQPQQMRRPEKEDNNTVDEPQQPVRDVETTKANKDQPQAHIVAGHQDLQDELEYVLEWQIKAQRVSEYSRYLRSMASHDARHLVKTTSSKNDIYASGVGGSVQHVGNEDTDMVDGGC